MRAFVPSSSWLNRTSRLRVAETTFTGTLTSPNPIVPLQIALGTRGPPWPSLARRALGSQSVPRPSKTVTEIEGRQLTLSNLDKVLYPATGFTKAAVVDYYARIAPTMLPHLRGRALTMVRWP